MKSRRQMVHTSCIFEHVFIFVGSCLHTTQCNVFVAFFFNPSGIGRLEGRRADWLPGDAALGLRPGRFGLWSLCQQREAGGNRPQGQNERMRRWSRVSIKAVRHRCLSLSLLVNHTFFAPVFTDGAFMSHLPSLPVYSTEPAKEREKKDQSLTIVLNWFFFLVECQKRKFAVARQHPFVRLCDPL